jgi:DNA-binding GntR family transcriptional regulator
MTSPAGRTILEMWILTELARADQLTPTELAARLSIPRAMVIDALIELAERGLLEDASPDEESAEGHLAPTGKDAE